MKKRLLSAFLSLCMMLTMVPTMAFAAGDGDSSQTIQNSPITQTQNGVTVSKSLSGKGTDNDPYKLTLEAYASNQMTTTSTTTPLDIVLVLDVSGSMDYTFGESTEVYEQAQKQNWSYNDINGWFVDTYYYFSETDQQYYKVEANWEWHKGQNKWDAYTEYSLGYNDESGNFHQLGTPTTNENSTIYNGVLYTKEEQTTKRLDAMQNAVNNFIDEVAKSSTSHQISIVSFASNANTKIGLTAVDENGVGSLKEIVNGLQAKGATNSADGLQDANEVLKNSGRTNAKKVVILFTDGTPTTNTDFNSSVASEAVNEAYDMKEDGVTVYTVGIFEGADPDNLTDDTNKYMNAVSSNYPNAYVLWQGYGYQWSTLKLSSLEASEKDYYFAAEDSESLNDVFQGIAESVTTGSLDDYDFANSTLTDVLSQYFDFPAGIDTNTDVEVKYAAATSYTEETGFTFETPGDLPGGVTVTPTVNGDTISITGFDYKKYAASYNETTKTVSGGKLVVTFPIELDEAACVAAQTANGYYPTNSELSLSYTISGGNKETATTESPLVPYDVSTYNANGTDITVQVYVDGVKQEAPLDLVNITRNTRDTTFNYFARVGEIVNGTITYDFDYNTVDGHDCVDIDVALTGDTYVLQGIVYNQDYGSNGGKDVTASGGTYTVDNVTAQGNQNDPDVKIYLRTKYTVQYYKDGTSDGTATGTFIAHEDVGNTSFTGWNDSNKNKQIVQSWKNSGYATSVTLKALPADVDNTTYTGWYLGSATNTGTKYDPNTSLAISAENDKAGSDAEDHIIKLYAVGQAKTGTVTIKYVNESYVSIDDNKEKTGKNGDEYTVTVASSAEDNEKDIPFVITTEEGTTYVFDHFTNDSAALSGQYKADEQIITAVYKVDSTDDEQYIPDDYIATVTYKIVNGTWDDGSNTKKTATFVTHRFDSSSNSWTTLNPTLGNSVPTGMKPAAGYDLTSGSWSPEIPTNSTDVVNGKEYTYTFSNKLTYTVTFNYVTDDTPAETLKNSETDSTQYTYEDSFTYSASHDETGLVPGVIEKDNNRYIYESADKPLSGTITDNVTITLTYTLDNWDDEDNEVTGGDDIPDKYQAVVKFVSADNAQGTVTGTGTTQVFTLKDSNDDPAETGSITPANTDVEAEAKTGYAFDIWTEGAAATTGDTGVNPFVAREAKGGDEITFYANFDLDLIGSEEGGDSTPDKYQAVVTYKVVGGTWSDNTSADIKEVFKLKNYDETTGQWKAANPTLGSTIPDEMKPDANHINVGSWNEAITSSTPVTQNVTYTYTFDAAAPGLSISKTLSSVTRGTATLKGEELNDYIAQVGDTLHYTITVKNTGNTVQSGTITDTFTVAGDDNATLTEGTPTAPEGCTVAASDDGWTFSNLAAKGTFTITADYTVKAGDKKIVNTVSSDLEKEPGNDNTVETNVADLTVKKTADPTTASIGDTIQYKITVTNTGGVALTNVEVTDNKMPSDITVTTDGGTPTSVTSTDGTYTIDSLDVGAKVEITYGYTVTAADVAAGSVSNMVTAGSDQTKEPDPDNPNDPGSDTTTTTILGIDTAEKSVVRVKPTIQDITFPENITYPETDQIAAKVGDKITLLYAVTLEGDAGAAFTVTENVADGTVAYIDAVGADGDFDDETNTFSGTLTAREATLYFTKTFTVTADTQSLTNSVTVSGISGETPSEEIEVVEPGLSVTKELASVTRGDSTLTGDALTDYVAKAGDVITYKLTVKNTGSETLYKVVVFDTMWSEGDKIQVGAATCAVNADGEYEIATGSYGLAPGAEQPITYTYTVTDTDVTNGSIINTATATANNGDESTAELTVPASTITISPADIVIYTGGDGYGGVTDGNGTIIPGTEASGLPEPGYHLELPTAVQEWLAQNGIYDGEDLSEELHFVYEGQDATGQTVSRDWVLKYAGVYSTNPDRYVYTLRPVNDTNPEVRITYFNDADEDGELDEGETVVSTDQITMGEDVVNTSYAMTINPGELDQSQVKAKFTVNGQTLTCNVEVETGTLTVKSVAYTDEETGQPTTNAIAADATTIDSDIITAVADDVKYYVNNSKVEVENENDRVQLLVDEVSNEPTYNDAMGEHAIDKVQADAAYANDLTNPAYDSAYLDLVDTENGNAVVTMGNNDKLTIYWPVPEDAASDSAFYVVHYTDMNRDSITANLNEQSTTIIPGTKTADGKYVTFEATSFSPYVLVYSGTHTVTFNKGANGSLADQDADGNVIVSNIADGSKLMNEQIPTVNANSGYSFTGWKMTGDTDPDKIYSNADIAAMEITDDLTFTAQYTSSGGSSGTTRYTLTYESNGGTEYDSERYTRNTVVELDKVPSREGYTFTGWYADEDLTEQITEIKMTSNKTVYAGWEATGVPDWLNGDDHFAYVIGYPDGTVRPLNNISRAEVATIFFRLLKPEIRDENLTTTNQFTDVDADAWYNTAVSTMAQLGIVKGRSADTFDPNAPITRAEFAAICARFDTNQRDGDSNFSDIAGHWAEAEIERAVLLGWINGYTDGTFRPDNQITRAEAMAMINRVLQRLPETEDDLLDDMNVWPDNQSSQWYYLAVQEATNSHDFERKDEVHEKWTEMTTDPDWTQYE